MALGDRKYSVRQLDIYIGSHVGLVIEHSIEAKDADASDKKTDRIVVQWEDVEALLTTDEQNSLDLILTKLSDVPKLRVAYLANATVE